MSVKEKILLVQLLLEDIRGYWGSNPERRALKAKSLCKEIAAELNDNDYMILADECDDYIAQSDECGDWDGKFFRHEFPYGYINMSKLHCLTETCKDKSEDFQWEAKCYFEYPENRLEDWEEYLKYEDKKL